MIKKKKNVLGRGLNALLKDAPFVADQRVSNAIQEIAIEQIQVNPYQPRKTFDSTALHELRDSIVSHGIIQPLTVRKLAPSTYQLIAGERRLKAAKMAGIVHIPAYIRTADDQQMLEIALIENIQRESLNPIEIALSYQRLLHECQIKQEILGTRVGKNRTTVNNYLRLLKLPPEIQVALRDQKVSMGHARALINVKDSDEQLRIFKKIIKESLSVRKVEAYVSAIHNQLPKPQLSKPKESVTHQQAAPLLAGMIQDARMQLSNRLGTPVDISVHTKKERGILHITLTDGSRLHSMLRMLTVG